MLNWLRRPDAKELGNSAFKEKNLDEAVLQYTRGLERCQGTAQTEERSKLLANRSAAHAKLGDYEAALADAEEAARLQPDWPKAWARKGKALTCLQRHKLAASSYARGLECALTLMQKNDERHEPSSLTAKAGQDRVGLVHGAARRDRDAQTPARGLHAHVRRARDRRQGQGGLRPRRR